MPFTAFTSGTPAFTQPYWTLPGGVKYSAFSGMYTSGGGGGLSGDKSFTFAARQRMPDPWESEKRSKPRYRIRKVGEFGVKTTA